MQLGEQVRPEPSHWSSQVATCRCTKYMGAVAYLIEHEGSLQQKNKSIRLRATWISAMAPYGVFGRPQRFTTHGLLSEELAMVISHITLRSCKRLSCNLCLTRPFRFS